jgi:hypothetical protein
MPSLSFSLLPCHIEAIREASMRLQVSQSQVVRDALDHFFPECSSDGHAVDEAGTHRNHGSSPAMARLVRELAGLRRELGDLRQMVAHLEVTQSASTISEFSPALTFEDSDSQLSPAD